MKFIIKIFEFFLLFFFIYKIFHTTGILSFNYLVASILEFFVIANTADDLKEKE